MGFTDDEKEIILGLADCNMNANELSRKIYMHRNTVIYRIGKIKRKTGLNPTNF